MRVLHVLHHSIPVLDGYSMRSDSIIRAQRAMGITPLVVTGPQHEPSGEPLEVHNGVEYYRTAAPARPWGARLLRTSPAREVAIVRSLQRRLLHVIRRRPVDLIHAHSPSLIGLAALRAARHRGLPIVYEVRAFWEDALVDQRRIRQGSSLYRLSRGLETYLFRRVNAVITLCDGLRREIAGRGIPPDKITVAANGVDPGLLRPSAPTGQIRERYGLEGSLVIGFIGSFYFYEGLRLLVENFPTIKNLCPTTRIKLMLVGRGEAEASLKSLASNLLAADDVIFTGQVAHESIRDYYEAMDLLVYPRLRNRMTDLVTPLKPLEAMALKRPVLASDVGGNKELIRDGENGRLFTAEHGPALVSRCVELLVDPARRAKLAEQAHREVLQSRSWPQVVKKHMDVYSQVYPPAGRARAGGDRLESQGFEYE